MTSAIQFIDFDLFINTNGGFTSNPTTIVNVLNTRLTSDYAILNKQINEYKDVLDTESNINDLLEQYKKEKQLLMDKLKNSTSDTLTNNRKTFYTDQENTTLDSYYFYLLIAYAIILVLIIIAGFITGKINLRFIYIIIIFVLLPLVSTYLLSKIIFIFYVVYNWLPLAK